MAMNAARNLGTAYGALSTSTQRLSSGLRVNTAADDAAGLAIRELMRADIKSLNQGVRNANDAISMIQTADGALGVIDEKLIRLKELAMQASTGTYSSDQRLMIDSEYQAMCSEITRIAMATDFNGIHLLNGHLSGGYTTHNGTGIESVGALKIHFGAGNDSSEDYYYINVGCATASAMGLGMLAGSKNKYTAAEIAAAASDPLLQAKMIAENSAGMTISTQELAQQALEAINQAIISKDKIRASLGAMQNRLENTITNLTIQAENLQASESRISDVDVATEMTEFTRQQILAQSAVAMLAQANSLPKMALQLIQG
jgi:flagellin